MRKLVVMLAIFSCVGVAYAKKDKREAGSCTKNISFSAVLRADRQVHPYMTGWIEKWIEKNQKNHSDVCFNQEPQSGLANHVIIMSLSPAHFSGVQIVNSTSTKTTPVSGSGSVSGSSGTWNYIYDGTVTTTTTTSAAVPYEIDTSTLYATAYDSNGGVVGENNHVYSVQQGGDGATAFGTNMGNLLRAINAHGPLLNGMVVDIERKRTTAIGSPASGSARSSSR
jgi:hypothetical protein